MLRAMDPSKQENDLFSIDVYSEDELLYEPGSSIINLTMVDDCELLRDDEQPVPIITLEKSNS